MTTILIVLFIFACCYANGLPTRDNSDLRTRRDVEEELAEQKRKWFKNRERIADLEGTLDRYMQIDIENRAKRHKWLAANPGKTRRDYAAHLARFDIDYGY